MANMVEKGGKRWQNVAKGGKNINGTFESFSTTQKFGFS
jgi:hypothetical protein